MFLSEYDQNDCVKKISEAVANKLPAANLATSAFSGFTLGTIFGIGETIGGQTRIVCGIIGTVWFVLSSILFVSGRTSFDWLSGKDTYWNVNKKTFIRGFVYFISIVIAVILIQNVLKMF